MNGIDEDPDHDGASNALEFAFGTDPLVSQGDTGLIRPELDIVEPGVGNSFAAIRFRARSAVSGVQYSAQVSTNLNDWASSDQANGPIAEDDIEMGDGSRRLRFRDRSPFGENSGSYLRAKADISAAHE